MYTSVYIYMYMYTFTSACIHVYIYMYLYIHLVYAEYVAIYQSRMQHTVHEYVLSLCSKHCYICYICQPI